MPRKLIYSTCIIFLLIFAVSQAMPPHPEALQRIRSGQATQPVFMSDPGYFARMGINQPSDKPFLTPEMRTTTWNTLVVLVEFPDQLGQTAAAHLDTMMFGQTYYVGPSLKEFYDRLSYGNLDLVTVNHPSVYGWWGLANNRYNYTAAGGSFTYGMGTYPNNSQGMCEEIVDLIDPVVDFSNYDNDSDGYVDGIIILHSGCGGEISLDTLDMWSHEWEIADRYRDGVFVKKYAVGPEFRYMVGDATVGVFAHEFGHIIGLPDLYDYGNDSFGLGYWSLMAYGGWNGNLGAPDTLSGSSPAFLDAWGRVKLGFVNPTNVACYVSNVHIPAVEDSARVYRLWTNGDTTSQEYFLVENRQSIFTDTALASHGLLIYHVDEAQLDNNNQWWPGQPPANHYLVALEQSDAAWHLEQFVNGMDIFDPFYAGFNSTFNNASSPSSQDYFGGNTLVSLTNITTSAYIMMADMDVGATVAPDSPELVWPDDDYVTGYQLVTLTCETMICASKYHIQIDDDPLFGSPLYEDNNLTYNYLQFSFYGHPDGQYYWRARAGNNAGWSNWSETRGFFMDRVPPYGSIASSPDTTFSSSFTVSWTAGTDPAPSGGICTYTVYADSGNGWYIWLNSVGALSEVFTGARDGVTYYFQARAWDCALNMETQDPPWAPECSTYASITTVGYEYLPGDANMGAGVWPPQVIGGDVTYLVSYFRGIAGNCLLGGFYCSGDANGDCLVIGSDVTRLVTYFRGAADIIWCDDYTPAWLTPADVPGEAPAGWPNCE